MSSKIDFLKKVLSWLFLLLLFSTRGASDILKDSWEHYKKEKIGELGEPFSDESHLQKTVFSESPSYVLLRAVQTDDAETFQRCYHWGKKNLQREELPWDNPYLISFEDRLFEYAPMELEKRAENRLLTDFCKGKEGKGMVVFWQDVGILKNGRFTWGACWYDISFEFEPLEKASISFFIKGDEALKDTSIKLILLDGDGEDWIWLAEGKESFSPPRIDAWTEIHVPLASFVRRRDFQSNPDGNQFFDRKSIKQIKFEAGSRNGRFFVDSIRFHGALQKRADKLFAWKWVDGSTNNPARFPSPHYNEDWRDAASDADTDIALALILALERTKSGTEESKKRWKATGIDYRLEAEPILADIWEKEVRFLPSKGNYYLAGGDKYKGMPDARNSLGVNVSYLNPAAYKIFEAFDPLSLSNGGFRNWAFDSQGLASSSYELLLSSSNQDFGEGDALAGSPHKRLPPNWLMIDAFSGKLLPNKWRPEVHFNWAYLFNDETKQMEWLWVPDAIRTLWHIALDFTWFKDERARQYLSGESPSSPYQLLKNELNSPEGKIGCAYYHNGKIAELQPKGTTNHCSEAIYLAFFAAALDAGADCQAEVEKLFSSLAKTYNPQGFWGPNPSEYYGQNWAWFGLALADGKYQHFGVKAFLNESKGIEANSAQKIFATVQKDSLVKALPSPSAEIVAVLEKADILINLGLEKEGMRKVQLLSGKEGWVKETLTPVKLVPEIRFFSDVPQKKDYWTPPCFDAEQSVKVVPLPVGSPDFLFERCLQWKWDRTRRENPEENWLGWGILLTESRRGINLRHFLEEGYYLLFYLKTAPESNFSSFMVKFEDWDRTQAEFLVRRNPKTDEDFMPILIKLSQFHIPSWIKEKHPEKENIDWEHIRQIQFECDKETSHAEIFLDEIQIVRVEN